jgi:hypothetical protein
MASRVSRKVCILGPRSFRGREMGSYVGPLGIGEVGLVCFSHVRYSTEPLSQKTFSDSFRR